MFSPISNRIDQSPTRSIAVIGGGPTGLATAYKIASAGHTVRLFEKSARVGGAVETTEDEGWLVEGGPNSLQENSRELVALWKELGLENERVVANSAAKKRYIVRDGKLRSLPSSPLSLLTTKCWSFRSRLGILSEWRRKPFHRDHDLSIEAMIAEHFGPELVDYALNPFVSGIYAGDPKLLSTRHAFPKIWQSEQVHGSLIKGMMAQSKARRNEGHPKTSMISFRHGLESITEALRRKLPVNSVELTAEVACLRPGKKHWSLCWRRGAEEHTESFDRVILAAPASALSELKIGSSGERPLEILSQIKYSAVASLFLGFPREAVDHPLDGFGLLVPAVEKLKTLGVIFSSTLFPERVPAGMIGLTVMVGGANEPVLVVNDIDKLTAAVMPELAKLLGVSANPVFKRLRVWPRAIPQYQLGYERFLNCMSDCEQTHPGLFIGGNVRNGIALPACLEAGLDLGNRACL